MSKIKIPNYSFTEELINSISHGIGGILSIVALILLVIRSHNSIDIITSCIYGSSMIFLYIVSCIYHALSPKISAKKVFRVLDHCSVFLFEAGTFTPLCLALIGDKVGYIYFIIIWIISVLGIILNCINVDKYQVISTICHLVVGWSVLLLYKRLITNLDKNGIILLISGGLAYSFGSILYGLGSKRKYMHSIFHFFVLEGSLLHFLMIYFYII